MAKLCIALFALSLSASVAIAAAPAKASAARTQYSCTGDLCNCTGDSDCNDMFTHAGCGDLSYCTTRDGRTFCECLKRPGQASTAKGIAYAITAVDLRSGNATVQDAKSGRRAKIAVAPPLLNHLKPGDKLYLRPNSAALAALEHALAQNDTKKTAADCEKCRSDCLDSISAKYHLITKDGKMQGDSGWEAAMRSCLSAGGCTGKDCPE